MLMEEWFQSLRAKAESVERKWPEATEQERLELAEQLMELRKISDRIVDLWLQFEEKLSHVIRFIKQSEGELPKQDEQDIQQLFAENDVHPDFHMFRKGEGFYHLRLYQDAKTCFADLLRQSPDWESGRLYYAYSLLFCDEKEAALKEFRLLGKSASSPSVVAISFNAIGCILAEEKQWLEAQQAFKSALEVQPHHRDAKFNLALSYLRNGEPQEALDTIEEVLQQSANDWEAQLIWLRAAKQLHVLDATAKPEPPAGLLPSRKLDTETLREMAGLYESMGNYHRAQVCYHFLTERLPREGWTWHGLAWNTWLIAGTKKALTLVKKAITLSPDNLDFHFSYGWMMLFDGRVEEAVSVFRFILLKQRDHRLAQSGLITAYERMGEWQSAKRLAETFTEDHDPYVRSLGCYHLGRIAVAQENWRLAEQYFRRALPHVNQFREIPLYLQLCATKLGAAGDEREPLLLQP